MIAFLFFALLCIFDTSSAQEKPDQDEIEAKIDSIFQKWSTTDSPGAAIAIVQDGDLIFKKGYGMSNLEYDIPIRPNTIFHVASLSKQFTGFAILLLEAQGKLNLDEDIRKYLPEMPDFGHRITIRHLAYHVSGLRYQWDLIELAGVDMHDEITQDYILKLVAKQKELNFPPGEKYMYCNTGYTLLAEIVAKVSGQSFESFTEEHIFDPLNMNDTHFHSKNEEIVKNRSYSYYTNDSRFWKSTLSYSNFGATSLFTTVEDLAKWLFNFKESKVGGSELIDKMLKSWNLNNGREIPYCFGITRYHYRGLENINHSGSDAGYRSFIQYFPEQKIGIVVLSNLSEFRTRSAAGSVAEIFLGEKFADPETEPTTPVEWKETDIDPRLLNDFVGEYAYERGRNVEIVKRNNQLFEIVSFRHVEYALFAASENRFFTKPFKFAVSFQRDDKGHVNQLTWHYPDGHERVAKKVNYIPLKTRELEKCTGVYWGEEVGTVYTIVLEDGQLIVKHIRNRDSKLEQYDKDAFRGDKWPVILVEFERDEKDNIIGLKMSTGRVQNLMFRKIE
jgi:CubicO group peptidase (beta-lactamase class C family)